MKKINTQKSGFSNNIGAINGKCSISEVEPVKPVKNDTWLDKTTNLMYRYDGTDWILMNGNCVVFTAGENLSRGQTAYISQTDGKVYKNPPSGYDCIGIVFKNASTNNDVYVVTHGLCYVLPSPSISLTWGYVAYVGSSPTSAGYVYNQSSISGLNYALVLGRMVESSTSAGALTLALIRPN